MREAKSHSDYLIAVLARDEIVERLKGKKPRADVSLRAAELKNEDRVDEVVAGDLDLGAWGVVKEHRPDVIALGYDQSALKENLELHLKDFGWRPEIVVMKPYSPDRYKSSLINLN